MINYQRGKAGFNVSHAVCLSVTFTYNETALCGSAIFNGFGRSLSREHFASGETKAPAGGSFSYHGAPVRNRSRRMFITYKCSDTRPNPYTRLRLFAERCHRSPDLRTVMLRGRDLGNVGGAAKALPCCVPVVSNSGHMAFKAPTSTRRRSRACGDDNEQRGAHY